MVQVERNAASFFRRGKLRPAFRDRQDVNGELTRLPMDFEPKPVFQQFLQHRPVHLRDGSIAATSFDIPGLRLLPVRTAENLHSTRILIHAVGEHAVRSLNVVLHAEAPDGKSSRRGRTPTPPVPTGTIGARLDRSSLEPRARLGRSEKRGRYQSVQDMSHIDILQYAV